MPQDLVHATDFELLQASRSGDEPFAVFYRRYERLVAGWLMRQTGRPEVAADLTAEVFAAAYVAAQRFRAGPEPAGAWLLGIARNKLLASLRRERTDTSARRRLGVRPLAPPDDEELQAIEQIDGSELLDLLDALPAEQRDAVRARVLEDLGYTELAATLDVTQQVARKRVSRGLRSLRKLADQQGVSP
jgi:RNA polymerase sigma factor (sigma-70 family)